MPFNFINIKEPERQNKVKTTPVIIHSSVSSSIQYVNINLVGRTESQMKDYICSMFRGAATDFPNYGLAFFTNDPKTLESIIQTKKAIEQFFWAANEGQWTNGTDTGAVLTYTFELSVPGHPSHTITITVRCYTPETIAALTHENCVTWYLLEMSSYIDADKYDGYLDFVLRHSPSSVGETGKTNLIITNTEKYVHFDDDCRSKSYVIGSDQHLITDRLEELFGAGTDMCIVPVKIYGGLDETGRDDLDRPTMYLSKSGYSKYAPVACEWPLLRSLYISAGGNDSPIGQNIRLCYGGPKPLFPKKQYDV